MGLWECSSLALHSPVSLKCFTERKHCFYNQRKNKATFLLKQHCNLACNCNVDFVSLIVLDVLVLSL